LAIIIPHLRGAEILRDCLASIFKSDFRDFEVILVDNASNDGSRETAAAQFPAVRLLSLKENRGYAGGCNEGVRQSSSDYVLLLNDDTILEPQTLGELVRALDENPRAALAQPKLLNVNQREFFDYSGACGGLMDILGYPFAFGRVFMAIEQDQGQFDSPSQIFWACGTAALFRRQALEEVGLLDEDFFAHMEEVDLAWRLHLAGYDGIRAPKAVVYHHSGKTLPNTEAWKMYLNHRNSLACLVKNYSLLNLVWILPIRIVLEWGTIVISLLRGDFRRGPAALKVQFQFPIVFIRFFAKRRQVQKTRRISDSKVMKKMYWGSVVVQHFVLGKRRTAQILHRYEL
jgi:hypothetical protein